MNEVIERLLSLQELDEHILRIEDRLEAGPRELERENSELTIHTARYEELSRQAKEATRAGERKNADLEEIDRKMKDLAGKQLSARTNKEYEAIKHEIAGLRADYEILEEEALQQWAVGEERESEADGEREIIGRLKAGVAERKAEWEKEAERLHAELESLRGERKERTRGIPTTWIQTYERVVASRGCPAVVEIVDRYCQGCQMHVTVHDVTRAIKGDEIVMCHACSRILYARSL